jgi:hypothetical protein
MTTDESLKTAIAEHIAPLFNTGTIIACMPDQTSGAGARYKCIMTISTYQATTGDFSHAVALVLSVAKGTFDHQQLHTNSLTENDGKYCI